MHNPINPSKIPNVILAHHQASNNGILKNEIGFLNAFSSGLERKV